MNLLHLILLLTFTPLLRCYWDDWLRSPKQRRGRQVIRPEVSRTYHFGTDAGTSFNQYGNELKEIDLVKADVEWEKQDLTHLEREQFREEYYSIVLSAQKSGWNPAEVMEKLPLGNVRVEYENWQQFEKNIAKLGLGLVSTNEKAGVPRTAFESIVEVRPKGETGHLLFFSPPVSQLEDNMRKGASMDLLDFSEALRVAPPPKKEHFCMEASS